MMIISFSSRTFLCVGTLLCFVVSVSRSATTAEATATAATRTTNDYVRRQTQNIGTTTVGNCVAGGSGYGLSFDYNRPDMLSFLWKDIPKDDFTFEAWFKMSDEFSEGIAIISYSAFNINGYQGQGGGVYESANEITLFIEGDAWSFWRSTTNTRYVNQRLLDIFDLKWHHIAFSYSSNQGGTTSFYLDGNELDQAITLLRYGNDVSVVYEKATFSNDWDIAEHPDSNDYLGDIEGQVVYVSIPCPEGDYTLPTTTDNVVAILKRSGECSDYEQARIAASKGARFVIFELEANEGENLIELASSSEQDKLDIPVVTVSYNTAQNIINEGSVTFTRSRHAINLGGDLLKSPEPGGVGCIGQDPDSPWGDFDPMQAMNGIIDEIRIWNVTRTPEQIKENYMTSIDTQNDPEANNLNVYWNFDDIADYQNGVARDLSPAGVNTGLIGALPTIKNEITYANGDPAKSPSRPDLIPTSRTGLVGTGDVVVAVSSGSEVIIELKSYDPDGDDLITRIVSEPAVGSIRNFENDVMLSDTDTVIDRDRRENKRVVYRAPQEFNSPASFQYSVEDGGLPIVATVQLFPYVVEAPEAVSLHTMEDTMTWLSMSSPSPASQDNYRVVITKPPAKGKLYQAQFDPEKVQDYVSLAKEVDQYGPMEEINTSGTAVNNSRGLVLYIPDEQGFSSPPGAVYETFSFKFVDVETGLESADADVFVFVKSNNDAPLSTMDGKSLSVDSSQSLTLELQSFDVDADTEENFSDRSFARITRFPKAGNVYHYDENDESNMGGYLDGSILRVPQVFSFATKVVRFSSQYSTCGTDCMSWKNPDCPSDCTGLAWEAVQLLGPPDVFPLYANSKSAYSLYAAEAGLQFIELEVPDEMYINGIEIYEVFKPGAIYRVSTTGNYTDDPSKTCGSEILGVPKCSMDSEWQTLWSKPLDSVTNGPESAIIFTPPLCPSTIKTKTIRLDLDTSAALGWNSIDAVKVIGSLDSPPGLLEDVQNRLVYVPRDGIHGEDDISFVFSDCLVEGMESTISIKIEEPIAGEFSSSFFLEEDIFLRSAAGDIDDYQLDLSSVLKKIKGETGIDVSYFNVTLWHTNGLGDVAGTSLINIWASDPSVNLALGVEEFGAPHSFIELWLTIPENDLTFRIQYRLLLCTNGEISVDTAINGRDVCVVEDDNLLSSGILAFGYVATAISWTLSLYFLSWIYRYRNDNVVKVSQIEFLVLICIGAMISSSTLIALSFQAGSGEDTDPATMGCMTAPFLYTIGWVIQYSSLSAKTFRLFKIMRSHQKGKPATVTFWSMFQIVLVAFCVDMSIVVAWTIKNPLVYEREQVGQDIDIENGLITIQTVGQCQSSQSDPSVWAFIGPLIGFHLILLVAANFLLSKVRAMKDRYQESKYITMAMVLMLEILIVGVPLIVAVKDSAAADYGVLVAIVALHDIGILCFIFIPKVIFQMEGPLKKGTQVESMILASFGKMTNSRWDEGLEIVNDLLEPESETRRSMTFQQAERLEDVKTLLVQGIQGTKASKTMHIPSNIFGLGKRLPSVTNSLVTVDNNVRYVLKEFGGVNVSTGRSVKSAGESSMMVSEENVSDDSSFDEYLLPEFQQLSQRRALFKLLSWSNLKQWDFNIFDITKLSGGNPLLFVGWAILGSPYSQYAMAKACGQDDVNLDDFQGYYFVGPGLRSDLCVPMKTLCDYLRVIENDYFSENPYHNEIHAADVLQTLHAMIQMKADIDDYSQEDLFSILLSAAVHDVNHPGRNNTFQCNARTNLALVYNDKSVLENRHISHAFMRMLGIDDTRSGERDNTLNILCKVSHHRFASVRSKVVEAVLNTDMSEHFQTVGAIKALMMAKTEEQLTKEERWKVLVFLLHLADISNPAKNYPLFERWADRCLEEFFNQGDKEAEMGLPISPNCDRRTTKRADSQIGFINFVIKPAYEVLAMCIPGIRDRVLPIIQSNVEYWEEQKAKKSDAKKVEKPLENGNSDQENGKK